MFVLTPNIFLRRSRFNANKIIELIPVDTSMVCMPINFGKIKVSAIIITQLKM